MSTEQNMQKTNMSSRLLPAGILTMIQVSLPHLIPLEKQVETREFTQATPLQILEEEKYLLVRSLFSSPFPIPISVTSIFLKVKYWGLQSAIHGLNRALDHPAIHIDGLAGNELGSVRGQKSHQVGDILRVAMMPQRNVLLGEPFDSLRA